MATDVSICSNALLRLGAAPINSFEEADELGSNIQQVRLCANLYPTVRKAILRAHPWNCATARVLLSPDEELPAFGFGNRFLLPSDWLRTLQVGESEGAPLEYRAEGRYLLSDEGALPLVYIFDNQTPASYDAALVQAMETAMCAALAYPVTKSAAMRDSLGAELKEVLRMARNVDGQDNPPETLGDSPLFASRFGPSVPGVR
jgi:hypothetical protein